MWDPRDPHKTRAKRLGVEIGIGAAQVARGLPEREDQPVGAACDRASIFAGPAASNSL